MNFDKGEMNKTSSSSMKNINNQNKQLLFDIDKGKYYLKYDDNIRLYNSNLFAQKMPKINPQAGFAKYNERILTNSIDKLDFKIDDSLYHPQPLKFEGYSQLPRPLIIPFSNITQSKLQKNLKEELGKTDIFSTYKNKNILNKKTNEGLSFYSGTINNIENIKSKNLVLNKINEALSEDDKQNIFSNKEKMKESEKLAIKKLKNKMISNSTNTIFGRKLHRPDDKFILQFKINYNVYFKNPIKKNLLKNNQLIESKDYYSDLYKTLNKDRVQKILKLPKKKLFLTIDDNNNNRNKFSQNCIYNNKIKTEIQNKKTEIESEKELFEEKKLNNELISNNNKNIEISDTKNSKNYFDSMIMGNENKFNTINYESKELLSEENEEKSKKIISLHKKNFFSYRNDNSGIKKLSDLIKNCKTEKKLLIGFNKPEIKEANYRRAVPKYKSSLDIYKKEWELYKLVNPIKYKLDEEKNLKELKFIQDKIEKGKDITSFGLPKKNNKFFTTSSLFSSKITK